jgi:hypothetical protein
MALVYCRSDAARSISILLWVNGDTDILNNCIMYVLSLLRVARVIEALSLF